MSESTKFMRKLLQKIMIWVFPQLSILKSAEYDFTKLRSWQRNVRCGKNVRIEPVHLLSEVEIGDYSYLSANAIVSNTTIGKFCSIGPNFFCGWGVHPTQGISTSPVFYSSKAKYTFSKGDKVEEHPHITIGNDVFIGANVTVLEGVTIGDGAIIGAGAVVSKDIPSYAIAVGAPIEIKKYRFEESQIQALQRIQWWHFTDEQLQEVEKHFFDVAGFVKNYDKQS